MNGKWLASQRRNRIGHYTVHYQMPGGAALCGKPFRHTTPATLNDEPFDYLKNDDACKGCKARYILFFTKGKEPNELNEPIA